MRKILPTHKLLSALALIALVCFLFSWSGAVSAMFFFNKKISVNLSPEVNGIVTLNGKPVGHVEVTRRLYFNQTDEVYSDSTITDSSGKFSLPEYTIEAKKPTAGMTVVIIKQNIEVEYEQKNYQMWLVNIPSLKPVDVIKEKLSFLNCDLSSSEEKFELVDEKFSMPFPILSICRWA